MKNNMTLGITLIIIGLASIIVGVVVLNKKENTSVTTPQEKISVEPIEKEKPKEPSDKEKGDDFEKFVVQKFSKKYFKVSDWTSDKFVNGVYAESNSNPDFTMRFQWKDVDKSFGVECKYRSEYYKNGIECCTERQLANYKKYESDKNQKVFIIIGVGGVASDPVELFIIPLNKIASTFLGKDFLSRYKKENFKEANLFYDYEKDMLK